MSPRAMLPDQEPASSTDLVEIRGLRLLGIVGVLPEERDRAQPLEIDLDLHCDLSAAGDSDDLSDTVDYGSVCDVVAATVASSNPELLERLAELVASSVLEVDARVASVTVALRKLRPPVPHAVASTGVRVHRGRGTRPT
jgi:7,8-dihydroneopterin aldolase/epimerase/oxygenase